MSVGERLKMLRKQKGLSQQALADQLGINRSTYARYETDDNQADYATLHMLADFFNISIDFLLGRDIHPNEGAYVRQQLQPHRTNEPINDEYAYVSRDLHFLIKDGRSVYFEGKLLDLDEREREDLLLHLRHALMMIKEKRQGSK